MVSENKTDYSLPSPQLLTPSDSNNVVRKKELREQAVTIEHILSAFDLPGRVVHISPGPVFSVFDFKPDLGVSTSRISKRVDDISIAFHGRSVRISPKAGHSLIGIEIHNDNPEIVRLRPLLESVNFIESESLLTLALGRTTDGDSFISDLTTLPHLLVAGSTGSGKSSCLHSIVLSILFKARPDDVKLILIDPRRVELGVYSDIPHLAIPIIFDLARASVSLRWALTEGDRRYKDLASYGVPNIATFNQEVQRWNSVGQLDENGVPLKLLPHIVIVIDEIGELLVSQAGVGETLSKLASIGRAVGIHLVVSTGRPSSEVVTPEIKANFPARIAFSTVSRSDSRTILDAHGAEELLGNGDALFLLPKKKEVLRIQSAYADFSEIKKVVDYVKGHNGQSFRPEYDTIIAKTEEELDEDGDLPGRRDPLFNDALKCVVQAKRGSTSLLQRHLRIGYGRSAAMLDAMVREGYIGEMDASTRSRPILAKAYEQLEEILESDVNVANETPIAQASENNISPSDEKSPNAGFGMAGAISILFFVITILLGIMGCSGRERSILLCITPITGLIALVAMTIELADATATGGPYYPSKPMPMRRGRPPNLFGRRRKSSIIKSIKRDIRKYGD